MKNFPKMFQKLTIKAKHDGASGYAYVIGLYNVNDSKLCSRAWAEAKNIMYIFYISSYWIAQGNTSDLNIDRPIHRAQVEGFIPFTFRFVIVQVFCDFFCVWRSSLSNPLVNWVFDLYLHICNRCTCNSYSCYVSKLMGWKQ